MVTSISVVGLGKIGTPLAIGFASRGCRVIGYDRDPAAVARLGAGSPDRVEPGLVDALREAGPRFSTTTDLDAAVAGSDVSFVIVPSPSDETGRFSPRFALEAAGALGRALRKKRGYHVVAIGTTLMPTTTAEEIRPLLERESGRTCGPDLGLCYVPEFYALGNALAGFLAPDMVLIGQSDDRAGRLVEDLYAAACKPGTPIVRTSLVNAELSKLGVNSFLALKVGFANLVARICETTPGGDADVVAGVMGLDSRIGRRFLTGGTAFGGPCLPRDVLALATLARQKEVDDAIPEAVTRTNRAEIDRQVAAVRAALPAGGRAGVLGLAFKCGTDAVDESAGLLIARALAVSGVPVTAFDPLAGERARAHLPPAVSMATTVQACLDASDVILISLPCDEFRRIRPADVARAGAPRTIIDCWRILDRAAFAGAADVRAGGIGP